MLHPKQPRVCCSGLDFSVKRNFTSSCWSGSQKLRFPDSNMCPSQNMLSEGSSSSHYVSYEEWQAYRGKDCELQHLNIVIQTTNCYCSGLLNRCFLYVPQRKRICNGHAQLKKKIHTHIWHAYICCLHYTSRLLLP